MYFKFKQNFWHRIYSKFLKHHYGKTSRGRAQDRSKVALGQDYEVNYEKEKTGASKQQIKNAIKAVGNSRKKVEKKLNKK